MLASIFALSLDVSNYNSQSLLQWLKIGNVIVISIELICMILSTAATVVSAIVSIYNSKKK